MRRGAREAGDVMQGFSFFPPSFSSSDPALRTGASGITKAMRRGVFSFSLPISVGSHSQRKGATGFSLLFFSLVLERNRPLAKCAVPDVLGFFPPFSANGQRFLGAPRLLPSSSFWAGQLCVDQKDGLVFFFWLRAGVSLQAEPLRGGYQGFFFPRFSTVGQEERIKEKVAGRTSDREVFPFLFPPPPLICGPGKFWGKDCLGVGGERGVFFLPGAGWVVRGPVPWPLFFPRTVQKNTIRGQRKVLEGLLFFFLFFLPRQGPAGVEEERE